MRCRLPQLLANGFTERARGAVPVTVEPGLIMIGRPIRGRCDGRHQNRAPEDPQEMIVHSVIETRFALLIRAGHRADVQRRAVRINDPLPGDEDPRLAVLDGVAILAYEPRPLRD